jgi:hypothetical protein
MVMDDQDPQTDTRPVNSGELNYKITKLCIEYLAVWGLSYTRINDVLGALEGAKQEFYRRVAIPYENGKTQDNGDVYPLKFMEDRSK